MKFINKRHKLSISGMKKDITTDPRDITRIREYMHKYDNQGEID